MKENAFAQELYRLSKLTGIKNAIFASAVQYDVSYISKWMGGRSLPSDKNIDMIANSLSTCIMMSTDEREKERLIKEYQCETISKLQETIRISLLNAYHKTKDTESSIIDQNLEHIVSHCYSHIDENIIAIIDIFSMGYKERLLMGGICNGHFSFCEDYSEIEYDLIIDLNRISEEVYDAIYLIHMMTGLSAFNIRLYNSIEAAGKFIFLKNDTEAVTGILLPGERRLIGACYERSREVIGYLRQSIDKLRYQDNIVFRKSSIYEMVNSLLYERSLISINLRWVLGHATEMILPDDLFDSLLKRIEGVDTAELKRLHLIMQRVVREQGMSVMIYESVFSEMVVSGELDFFNHKIFLTQSEKLSFLDYFKELISSDCLMNLKLIAGYLNADFKYVTNPCIFLSDMVSYVRLENGRYQNNIMIINDQSAKNIFKAFYSKIWNERDDIIIDDRKEIYKMVAHYRASVYFTEQINS